MTDRRNDDEVLGRALSRAIETQEPSEKPYERSRIATCPERRGLVLWQVAGVAAALVFAVAIGSWCTRPTAAGPVAASPSATASAPTATSAPASSVPGGGSTVRTFFVRDSLPPLSVRIAAAVSDPSRPENSIGSRLSATYGAPASAVPFGAANPLSLVGRSGNQGTFGVSVGIAGDTANVELDVPLGWNIHGAAQVQALVQQLVYVITEEPGIRKARITEKGKTNAVIDGLVVDKTLSREDVTDYDHIGSTKAVQGFGDATTAASRKLRPILNVDTIAPVLARFVVETDLEVSSPGVSYPDFKVEMRQLDDPSPREIPGKWSLVVTVNGQDQGFFDQSLSFPVYQAIDKSPVRGILTTKQGTNTVYQIGLDDLRPWRTAIAFRPFRIIVDIGGDPRTIFDDSNAVYAPGYGAAVARTFQVSGVAHNFEAHVDIRVLDDKQKEVYRGGTTATSCCDPGGTFDTTVQLPASVTGNIYLEVFEASAKDGSDTKVIRIPLTVR
jgi:hypothetical protein